ncbi:hypothetical protein HK096_006977 [Nowakowskiella sp. JEL0078]|nr:hypothetical protein HK096_006977 [Nowakowskiella sp. JEL0078]
MIKIAKTIEGLLWKLDDAFVVCVAVGVEDVDETCLVDDEVVAAAVAGGGRLVKEAAVRPPPILQTAFDAIRLDDWHSVDTVTGALHERQVESEHDTICPPVLEHKAYKKNQH